MTSVGFGCADPLAGLARLFALLARRFASAALRLARLRALSYTPSLWHTVIGSFSTAAFIDALDQSGLL